MRKTAEQIAINVIQKCAELSEQDKANLEYIEAQNLDEVNSPSYARTMGVLGGVGGVSAATGSFVGGNLARALHAGYGGSLGSMKDILRTAAKHGLIGAGVGGAAGLGISLAYPHLQAKLNEQMKEQRDEILSRQ